MLQYPCVLLRSTRSRFSLDYCKLNIPTLSTYYCVLYNTVCDKRLLVGQWKRLMGFMLSILVTTLELKCKGSYFEQSSITSVTTDCSIGTLMVKEHVARRLNMFPFSLCIMYTVLAVIIIKQYFHYVNKCAL